MREIKFRGQDFYTGEWRYGSYNGVNAGAADVFIIYEREIFDPVSLGFIDTEIVEKEVKEETIGQYTGLKDKNGVEIYEGDICIVTTPEDEDNDEEKTKTIVAYQAPMYLWRHVDEPETVWRPIFFNIGGLEIRHKPELVEVIGNIHENPELLEAEAMTDSTQEIDEILQPIRNYADIVEIDVAKQAILELIDRKVKEISNE